MVVFKSERTIDTRGITFTPEQMKDQRINRICNTILERGTDDYDPMDFIYSVQEGNPDRSIIDAASTGEYTIVSLIVFEDMFSRNIFAIRNKDYYGFHPDLVSLYN